MSSLRLRKRRSAPPYAPCGSQRTERFTRVWNRLPKHVTSAPSVATVSSGLIQKRDNYNNIERSIHTSRTCNSIRGNVRVSQKTEGENVRRNVRFPEIPPIPPFVSHPFMTEQCPHGDAHVAMNTIITLFCYVLTYLFTNQRNGDALSRRFEWTHERLAGGGVSTHGGHGERCRLVAVYSIHLTTGDAYQHLNVPQHNSHQPTFCRLYNHPHFIAHRSDGSTVFSVVANFSC